MADMPPPASRQDIIQMLATEHFTLQSARSITISDTNGRTSFFLGTLSSVVVALAFMAQLSGVGQAFVVFALILLPTLLFIGLVTFERLLQLGIENIRCVVAINRVRHYYLEVAPELGPHFTLSPHDDTRGILLSLGSISGRVRPWDVFVTNAGMVAVLNGIIAGVIGGMLAWKAGWGMDGATLVGAVLGLALVALLILYQVRGWRRAAVVVGARFPYAGERLDTSHIPSAVAQQSPAEASDGGN
jgi:hypothetical protein